MSEALLNFFIYNDEKYNISEFDNLYVEKKPSIYEVIRVMNGVPLFLEEHYERLIKSADVINHKLEISYKEVKKSIYEMVKLNSVENYNIKIVVNDLDGIKVNKYYFFIGTNYPSEGLYSIGIKTFLYNAERKNPHAKVINNDLRNEITKLLKEKDCYEALLVNNDNQITEGSKSNLFFIKGDTVFTTPAKDVLLGITRQRILSLCKKNNIKVIECPISVQDLRSFNSAFICGTSPKILPISLVDDIKFSTDDSLLKELMKIYDKEINHYIDANN